MKTAKMTMILVCWWMVSSAVAAAGQVLIVADEFPAMEILARQLQARAGVTSTIVAQTGMPADLSRYLSVVVYIHRGLDQPAEEAFIAYAQGGGKLMVLHHSISSGKRKNRDWFRFLQIELPEKEVSQGGYKWIEGVSMRIVSLAPSHIITKKKIHYPAKAEFQSTFIRKKRNLPCFTLDETEVYLNHVLLTTRTLLLGLIFTDTKTGVTYQQDHAGWYMPAGKGWVYYFLPGHSGKDFENPAYAQILANALLHHP